MFMVLFLEGKISRKGELISESGFHTVDIHWKLPESCVYLTKNFEKMRKFPKYVTFASFSSPFFTFPEITGEEKHGGIFGRFLALLSQTLQFEYSVVSPRDERFGSAIRRGNVTVVYDMLKAGVADVSLKFSVEERPDVDMTVPFWDTSISFATEFPKALPKAYAFVYPFDVITWIGVLCVLTLIPLVLSVTSKSPRPGHPKFPMRFNGDHKRLKIEKANQKRPSLVQLYFYTLGDVLRQSWPNSSGAGGRKHLLFNWWVFAFVISSSYSGILLSFLTVPRYETPVRDFAALSAAVKRGEYEAFFKYGTNIPDEFRWSGRRELVDIIDEVDKNGWFIYDGVSFQFSSRKKKSAHVTVRVLMYLMHGKPPLASKFISTDDAYTLPTKLAVRKTFCCKEALDVAIRRIRNAGLFEKCVDDELFMRWVRSKRKEDYHPIDEPLSLSDLSCAFFILCFGYALSLLALVFEILGRCK